MKKLNTITFNDIVSGFECSYKKFKIIYNKSYINIFYNEKNIDTFMCTSKKVSELKKRIKLECNLRDIDYLKKLSTNALKKYFSRVEDIEEKIISYCNLLYMKRNEDTKFLLQECRNYFIYRLFIDN